MKTERATLESVEDFLAEKRIAVVGVSHEPKEFSGMLFAELKRRGYDVIPVNPNAAEMFGRRCFARVQEIEPRADAALLMTSPAVTETVVRDCAEAGIRKVWMYRAGGPKSANQGAVSAEAVEFCRTRGIDVVPGECPYMFLPEAGYHRIHGFIRKITGSYPRHEHRAAA